MHYFLIGVVTVLLAIIVWFQFVEAIFCRNALFLSKNMLQGATKILRITFEHRVYPANFQIADDASVVCTVTDKMQLGTRPNKILRLHFCGIEFGLQFNTFFRTVEFFEKYERIGVLKQLGLWKNTKFLNFQSRDLTLIHPESWSPDLEVFDMGVKLARITYEPTVYVERIRKIILFQNMDIRMEALLCMVTIFSKPKFGRLGKYK